jgi:hypothetical protein
MTDPVPQPRLTIILHRGTKTEARLPLYVRELPGMLAPPAPSTGTARDAEPAGADTAAQLTEVEIDPLVLRDLTHLRAFLAKIAAVGTPVHLWCWDARLERLLNLVGAAADATEVEVDLAAS